jgi:hypothetical protein
VRLVTVDHDVPSLEASIKIEDTLASPLNEKVNWYCPVIESPVDGPFEKLITRFEEVAMERFSCRSVGGDCAGCHNGEAAMPAKRKTSNAVTAVLPMDP